MAYNAARAADPPVDPVVGDESATSLALRDDQAPVHSPVRRPPIFLAGEVVGGRFKITRLLGRGGMGQVYEAIDLELSTAVALKAIRPELTGSPLLLERFRHEVEIARRVTHGNVCRIFDLFRHGEDDSPWGGAQPVVHFFSMELVDGHSLRAELRSAGTIEPTRALEWGRQVAAGLAAVHRAGVAHGDVKPENVLVGPRGPERRLVLGDFGLARAAAFGSEPGPRCGGTPAYSAPEGFGPTPAADLYAFGLVLHEMVAGRPADPREARERLWTRQSSADRRLLAAIVRRCLEVEPDRRYGSAGEVVEAIDRSRSRRRRLAAALRRLGLTSLAVSLLV